MVSTGTLDMMKEEEKNYRGAVRNLFMDKMANYGNHQHKHHTCRHLTDEAMQPFKDLSQRAAAREKQEMDLGLTEHHRYLMDQAKSSGGDADRVLYDSYRHCSDHKHSLRHLHPKGQTWAMSTGAGKYQQVTTPAMESVNECIGNHQYICETVSNMGDICNRSEGSSSKSQKSSKTVVSRKTSHDLRNLVKSKCKLQEQIDETLQQLCNPEDLEKNQHDVHNMLYDKSTMQLDTLPLSHCKHCTDKEVHPLQSSQKDVTTEILKTDFAECHNGDTLTISVDDVVNSKVINPMIRKLQRMYLNNLKEEMSLMEDLERLPHKVNEVYKATIFKNRE